MKLQVYTLDNVNNPATITSAKVQLYCVQAWISI